ncbi:MAG: hypothetical protein ALECFALPRED_010571 [Alectoria fallacina]|uniref:COP9 signalosome complex subunit 6 n=1 Tax=Alectoria fallacina TaxID=1903189 RepID=A0A8H3I615_9LECA|nr:MAG: hypothetical protein ALECFALPRED_010571 [Alectoria fallacina]
MASTSTSLLSNHKSPSSDLHINLHPLILLTISDYLTRHTLRRQTSPIIGALIGQQSGRSVSLEHAFDCQTVQNNGQILLHEAWFKDRLQQYKDVHLAPALDVVGWFTTTPVTGPEGVHVPIHQQILHTYNETAVLLAFHPSSVLEGAAVGGKLPLTIYESVYDNNEGQGMEIDGAEALLDLKFRELPYSVETGEAEMISVDFVARGGGNATAIDSAGKDTKGQASQKAVGQVDKKGKAVDRESKAVDDSSILSSEDEELIASLTARANAVKMLHTRIQLLKAYLTSLPPSYLTAATDSPPSDPTTPPADTPISELNHPLLRSILALLSRLPLLLPPEHHSTFRQETLAEKSDVELVSLLGSLGKSVKEAREMGRKFGIVEGVLKGRGKSGFAMGGGGMDDVWSQGLSGDGGLGGGSNGEGMSMEGAFAM